MIRVGKLIVATMNPTKYKLIAIAIIFFAISVVEIANISHRSKQDSQPQSTTSGVSGLSVTTASGQTLTLNERPDQTNQPDTTASSVNQTSSSTAPSGYSNHSSSSSYNPNLMQYLPNYVSTPPPTFDYGRTAPTLNVPPIPSCGQVDSSDYGNCIDSYCLSYPDTAICENR
jgi:hypothetical protein